MILKTLDEFHLMLFFFFFAEWLWRFHMHNHKCSVCQEWMAVMTITAWKREYRSDTAAGSKPHFADRRRGGNSCTCGSIERICWMGNDGDPPHPSPPLPQTAAEQFSHVGKAIDKWRDPTLVLHLWKYACAKCEFFAEVRLCETRSGTLTVHISTRSRQKHPRHLCTSTVFRTGTTVRGHRLNEEQIQPQEMLWSWEKKEKKRKTKATTQFNSNSFAELSFVKVTSEFGGTCNQIYSSKSAREQWPSVANWTQLSHHHTSATLLFNVLCWAHIP